MTHEVSSLLISSFIPSYSLTTYIKRKQSRPIYESVKDLESKHFYAIFFAQIFNTIAELIILFEISTKEAKAEIEMHTVTAKTKIRRCSMQFRVVQTFLFLLLNIIILVYVFNTINTCLFHFFNLDS